MAVQLKPDWDLMPTPPKEQERRLADLLRFPTHRTRRPARSEMVRYKGRVLVRDDVRGHYFRDRAKKLQHVLDEQHRRKPVQKRILSFLHDNVHPSIPRRYYKAVLGHDLHIATYGQLTVKHFHATEPDPFTGEIGWLENIGLVSEGFVGNSFRDFEIDQLIAETSVYGDFKFHRVGTGTTAEAATQAALVTDAGLEGTGTQVEAATDQYRSVAVVTADVSETWEEHSIRNATGAAGGTMMDRSLISPNVPVVASDTVTFTYTLTKVSQTA